MIIRPGTPDEAAAAAALHASEITEGFLPTLGHGFLTRLYRRVARHPESTLLVAEHEGRIVGFAASTHHVGRLYRAFLLRDGLVAGIVAAPRLLRSTRKVVETLRYGSTGEGELPDAELLAIAVDPSARGAGIGRQLVAAVLDDLATGGIHAARVVVAAHNEPAKALYRSAGFVPAIRTEVHTGTVSEVLTWS